MNGCFWLFSTYPVTSYHCTHLPVLPLGHASLWHSRCCCGKLTSRLDWPPDWTQQSQANLVVWQEQKVCPRWGSNSRPSDYETDALPTALRRLALGERWTTVYCDNLATTEEKNSNASAGNRTRVNCLEGSYAHHYTTDALGDCRLFCWKYICHP